MSTPAHLPVTASPSTNSKYHDPQEPPPHAAPPNPEPSASDASDASEGSAAGNTKKNKRITGFIELVGSFFLGLAGLGSICYYSISGSDQTLLWASIWFGVILAIQVYAWHMSGCHLNWLVTIGLVVAGKFPKAYLARYMVMQALGYLAAAYVIYLWFGQDAVSKAFLGAAFPVPEASWLQQLATGAAAGGLFVLVIILVAGDNRAKGQMAGIIIGTGLAIGIYFSAKYAGGGLNTPRELAPMILSSIFGDSKFVWLPYVGEFIGALLAGKFYRWIGKAENPSET